MRINRVSVPALVSASIVALAMLALTSVDASAATIIKGTKSNTSDRATTGTPAPTPEGAISLNSSRSNTYRTINSSDPNDVQACKTGGGHVGKDPNGHDACMAGGKSAQDSWDK